jgi:lipopolysaccharide transport system permease protein
MKKFDELIIGPGSIEKNYWHDLWAYRGLLYVLARRDILVRYKQTIIGFGWALIRPFLTMVVFTVIFGKIANLQSGEVAPYALLVYCGLLPWQLFSGSLGEASTSITGNAGLISKVYFPRLIVPIASIVVVFVDFLISLLILIGLMFWYKFIPAWQIITLPFFILMAILSSIGPGLWITAMNVKYRDFRYVIPFILQLGLYVSPVGFSSSVVPDKWKLIYSINPMVGVIDGFRWSILGNDALIYWPGFLISWIVIIIFLLLGVNKFRKMESNFSDFI